MPLLHDPKSNDHYLGAQQLEYDASGVTANVAVAIHLPYKSIVILEVGLQAHTLAGSTPSVRATVATLSSWNCAADPSGAAPTGHTLTFNTDQITAAGIVIARNPRGVAFVDRLLTKNQTGQIVPTDPDLNIGKLRLLFSIASGTVSDWSGKMWVKYTTYI